VKNGKIPTLLDIIKNSMSPLKVQLFEKNKLRDKIERLQ
jgi:hypothetical protein